MRHILPRPQKCFLLINAINTLFIVPIHRRKNSKTNEEKKLIKKKHDYFWASQALIKKREPCIYVENG